MVMVSEVAAGPILSFCAVESHHHVQHGLHDVRQEGGSRLHRDEYCVAPTRWRFEAVKDAPAGAFVERGI